MSCANQAAAPVTRGKLGHYQLPCHFWSRFNKTFRPCLRKSRQPSRCACVVVRRSAYKLRAAVRRQSRYVNGDSAGDARTTTCLFSEACKILVLLLLRQLDAFPSGCYLTWDIVLAERYQWCVYTLGTQLYNSLQPKAATR